MRRFVSLSVLGLAAPSYVAAEFARADVGEEHLFAGDEDGMHMLKKKWR